MKPAIVNGEQVATFSDDGRHVTLYTSDNFFTLVGILWSMMAVAIRRSSGRPTEHIARRGVTGGDDIHIVIDPKTALVTFRQAGQIVLQLGTDDVLAIEAQRKATTDEYRRAA